MWADPIRSRGTRKEVWEDKELFHQFWLVPCTPLWLRGSRPAKESPPQELKTMPFIRRHERDSTRAIPPPFINSVRLWTPQIGLQSEAVWSDGDFPGWVFSHWIRSYGEWIGNLLSSRTLVRTTIIGNQPRGAYRNITLYCDRKVLSFGQGWNLRGLEVSGSGNPHIIYPGDSETTRLTIHSNTCPSITLPTDPIRPTSWQCSLLMFCSELSLVYLTFRWPIHKMSGHSINSRALSPSGIAT